MAPRGVVRLLLVVVVAAAGAGCGEHKPAPEVSGRPGAAAPATSCSPTYLDELSPSYRPDAPVRNGVVQARGSSGRGGRAAER
jgi:hypothetical protein